MKFKFLVVIIGTFFLTGCTNKPNSEVESFKLNLSSEKYEVASEIYKENEANEEFKKYADEFVDNDIKNKEKYLDRKNYVEIEEDLDIISDFYNSEELIKAKERLKAVKIELSLENNKLMEKNIKLEGELQQLKEKMNEEENLKNGVFEYKTYVSERWKYSIEYPSFFDKVVASENGENVSLTSTTHGGIVILDAWNRDDKRSIDELFDEELVNKPDMPYKYKGEDFYVISWREGDLICYQKALIGSECINSVILKYPENEKEFYNPILEKIYESFNGGDLNIKY